MVPRRVKTAGQKQRRYGAIAVAAALMLHSVASFGAAGDECRTCERENIEHWPICSPEQINAASRSTHVDPTLPVMTAGTFAREAQAALPGRARFKLTGVINTGGAACVGHVATILDGMGLAQASHYQRIGRVLARAAGASPEIGEQVPGNHKPVEEYFPELPAAVRSDRKSHVLLRLFTPNIQVQQTGMLADAISIRHNGIGGWRPNGFANLILQLPDTRPEELEAGGTYRAIAIDSGNDSRGGWLYRDWDGRFVEYYSDGPPVPALAASFNQLLAKVNGMIQKGSGDATLRGPGQIVANRNYAFTGTQRYVDADLTGEVTIDRITKGGLSGHFKVSGAGHVLAKRYKLVYQKDRLVGDRLVASQDIHGDLTAKGRFQAPNYRHDGNVALGSPVTVSGKGAPDAREPLHITGHSPGIAERNVDWQNPRICVTFDSAIDIAALNAEDFYLEYRDGHGELQTVGAYYRRISPRQARLVPKSPLKDGVRYRVRLKAGNNGVHGRNGQPLDGPYGWTFYTMVDLDDTEAMPDLENILDKTEGIELHVFQVSRDATLIPGKPALTRIRAKWKEREDVDPDWQVKRFLADVRVSRGGKRIYDEKKNVLIERPDQYEPQDKRSARNTVNLYGWQPRRQQTGAVEVEIEPVIECARNKRTYKSRHPVTIADNSPTLTVDYYTVAAADVLGNSEWQRSEDTLGQGDTVPDWVHTVTPAIAQQGARFTTQNFPVVATHMRSGGVVTVNTGVRFPHIDGRQYSNLSDGLTDTYVAEQVYAAVQGTTDADVIMMIMPSSVAPRYGGYTYKTAQDATPAQIALFYNTNSQQAFSKQVTSVAHEMGHVYGLSHYARGQTVDTPLEGFRVAPSGESGWNKSGTDGNEEGSLAPFPLMRVGEDPYRAAFITNENYAHLLRSEVMTAMQGRPLFKVDTLLASRGTAGLAAVKPGAPPDRIWRVSGIATPGGEQAILTTVQPDTGELAPERTTADGEFRAVLVDAHGDRVAAKAFSLDSSPSSVDGGETGRPQAFHVDLPRAGNAARLEIYHGDQRIQWRDRSAHAPDLDVTIEKAEGGRIPVAIDAHDADGDKVAVSLYYAADGRSFQPLLLNVAPGTHNLPVARIGPGKNPTLRVIASDGFNHTRREHAVASTTDFGVSTTLPDGNGGNVIGAVFNGRIDQGTGFDANTSLIGPDGEPIAVEAVYDDYSRFLRLRPDAPLSPGHRYTAKLSAAITGVDGQTLGEEVEWSFTVPPTAAARGAGTKAADAADKNRAQNADADNAGRGTIEWNGHDGPLRIGECSRSGGLIKGINVSGRTVDGVRLKIFVMNTAKGSRHSVIIEPNDEAGTPYGAMRENTGEGWTRAIDNTAVDGPLVTIQGQTLTVNAHLESRSRSRERKSLHANIHCPGLAAGDSADKPG